MRREQSAAIAVRQATTVQFNLTGNPTAPVSQDRQSHPYHREHVMENDQGLLVDLYVPRKCAATNRLITSKDHASVQVVIADVDANGRALTTSTSFALSGQVRAQGEGDDSLNRLATKAGLLRNVWSYQK